MEDRLQQLESRVEGLVEGLARLDSRLSALESDQVVAPTATEPRLSPIEAASLEADSPSLPLDEKSLSSAATHLGRILLIFGGAYLLRALTDFEILPAGAGVFLGGVYALSWLVMAYRAGGTEARRPTAVLYGIASTLMTLPLLVETTTRFQLLSGSQGAAVLTVFFLLALTVSVIRELRSLGWLATIGAMVTALVLLRMTHAAAPYAMALLVIGLASLWAVYLRGWKGLHWFGALGADLGIVIVALLSSNERWTLSPMLVYALAISLLLLFLLSFAIRSHLNKKTVGWFETVQGVFVIAATYWAVFRIVSAENLNLTLLGVACLALGIGAYALAFSRETRSTRGRNFFFYSTLGLALVVGGSSLLMSPGKAAAAWSLMAVIMAWFSGRYGRVTLSLQCTLLLIAAGVSSGVLGTGIQALAGNGAESWPTPSPWQLIVGAATVVCLFIPVAQHSERWGRLAGLPQLTVLALSVWEVGGLIVTYLAPMLTGVPGAEADLGLVAVLRTAVLSASAITLSLSSRHKRWPEARWLAYPVLLLVGLKLIFEDFPHGRPLTLFLALAVVGGALIAVARLLRRERPAEAEA
jgi:hypothetical protein